MLCADAAVGNWDSASDVAVKHSERAYPRVRAGKSPDR